MTLSADMGYLQRRVSSSCSAGSSIRIINSDGTVSCEEDTDTNSGGDITAVIAGTGLTGGGTSSDVTVNAEGTTEIELNYEIRRDFNVTGGFDSEGNSAIGFSFERDY